MSRLTTRLEALKQRRPRLDICPEHKTTSPYRDYRAGLAPFLPDEERASLPAADDIPACGRCGWRWEMAFDVVVRPDWGQHEPT